MIRVRCERTGLDQRRRSISSAIRPASVHVLATVTENREGTEFFDPIGHIPMLPRMRGTRMGPFVDEKDIANAKQRGCRKLLRIRHTSSPRASVGASQHNENVNQRGPAALEELTSRPVHVPVRLLTFRFVAWRPVVLNEWLAEGTEDEKERRTTRRETDNIFDAQQRGFPVPLRQIPPRKESQ